MKTYSIREVFDTLQGEGARAGERSVFVRFAGCNLWDGNPAHRDQGKGYCARWCDTDFAHGKATTAEQLLDQMDAQWPKRRGEVRWCVLSGGEPTLQVDRDLLYSLAGAGWQIAMETNGTRTPVEDGTSLLDLIDHLTVSPKLGAELKVTRCDELKVVLPGAAPGEIGWSDALLALLPMRAGRRYVQPQDPVDLGSVELTHLKPSASTPSAALEAQWWRNLRRCIDFVKAHPAWRLSLQTHKWIRLP